MNQRAFRPFRDQALALTVVLGLGLAGAMPAAGGGAAQAPLEADRIVMVIIKEGRIASVTSEALPEEAYSMDKNPAPPLPPEALAERVEKIHPLLEGWLDNRGPQERVRVLISFQNDETLPLFPEPVRGESPDSQANREARERAQQIIERIQARRAETNRLRSPELAARYEVEILDSFWIIDALLAEMPLGRVRALAERADVVYVEPSETGELPPGDDVVDGRNLIQTDPYFNLGLSGQLIGLLDTGMRFTHVLFNNPSHIRRQRDCVPTPLPGVTDCSLPPGDPTDDCWNHGTSTGAILTGNGNQGNAFRGVSAITLDSYKIYPNGCGGLHQDAVLRAFQAALGALDRVIVAEMQGTGGENSAITAAGDNAFSGGAVVIAANGNYGPNSGTVASPANGHRVIGVGAVNVVSLATPPYQSRGPAGDGRIKPDFQAPTDTETASSASDTARHIFGGTSGSTPYGAGAAALVRNWLLSQGATAHPAQVYTQLILAGSQTAYNNDVGVGVIRLQSPSNVFWRGNVSLGNAQVVDIPLAINANDQTLDGAIWWPETYSQLHNNVELSLIDPAGNVRVTSETFASVFEKVRVAGALSAGTWKLRIRMVHFLSGSAQTVYWAASVFRP